MQSYGNRGMTFESLIEYANRHYKNTGEAIITKQHTHFIPIRNGTGKIVTCKVEEKATVDYMGRFGNIPIAFEAKHCAEDKIDLKRVEPHQSEFLCEWTKGGKGIGFILVSFRFAEFYLIPHNVWLLAIQANEQKKRGSTVKPLTWGGFVTTGKASIRKDELPDTWQVESGTTAALAYLKTVKELWRT